MYLCRRVHHILTVTATLKVLHWIYLLLQWYCKEFVSFLALCLRFWAHFTLFLSYDVQTIGAFYCFLQWLNT